MTVTGCDDCPLSDDWDRCVHPESVAFVKAVSGIGLPRPVDGEAIPSWCPLRTAPLTIALETK